MKNWPYFCMFIILCCLLPFAVISSSICDCVRWLKAKRKLWTLWIPVGIVVLIVYCKYSSQIEDPEVIKTLQNINIGLMLVGVGVIVSGLLFGRKK